jgi:hypothetical protein
MPRNASTTHALDFFDPFQHLPAIEKLLRNDFDGPPPAIADMRFLIRRP